MPTQEQIDQRLAKVREYRKEILMMAHAALLEPGNQILGDELLAASEHLRRVRELMQGLEAEPVDHDVVGCKP